MNKRDFLYATSILRTIRQRIKAGWKHEAQEDISTLNKFLNGKDYELTESDKYGFTIKPLER